MAWLKERRHQFAQIGRSAYAWVGSRWGVLIELGVIGLWAIFVGRNFLDFDPYTWPLGREFGSQIQAHHFWTQLQQCGLCALWNGGINGGVPALADPFSSTFHPAVMIPTLLWGVIVGTKVAIVLSLWIAGLAQWRLASILKLGLVARMWSAFLVVAGAHLLGRLEDGAVAIVISTAACSLALVAAIELGVKKDRGATLRFAIALALAIVAGQGYLQLALLIWAPAFLFLLLDQHLKLRPVWREYLLGVFLGLLLAGIFLVPLLNFLPNFAKSTDPVFGAAQPLEYIPLNLFIRDRAFMVSEVLGKLPFGYMYNLYLGWVPILLAALCLRFARREDYAILLCLGSGAALTFFVASAVPLRWLGELIPMLTGFRFAPLVAGLAIPAIVGLAAYGLDRLLALDWPDLTLRLGTNESERGIVLNLAWILVIPLFWSLQSAYALSQNYTATEDFQAIYESTASLQTPNLQWVATPFGEHYWVEPALAEGLKLSPVVWAWDWLERSVPEPKLVASRQGPPPDTEVVGALGDIPIYQHGEREYAYVDTGGQNALCLASGRGGDMRIRCDTDRGGQLIVEENSLAGWRVWRDEEPVSLRPTRWLSTDAPVGEHDYRFSYRPWDVTLGFILTLSGIVLIFWLWFRLRSTSDTT